MRKNARDFFISIFLILVPAVWLAFLAVPQPAEFMTDQQEGTVDLAEFHFDNKVFFYHGF